MPFFLACVEFSDLREKCQTFWTDYYNIGVQVVVGSYFPGFKEKERSWMIFLFDFLKILF